MTTLEEEIDAFVADAEDLVARAADARLDEEERFVEIIKQRKRRPDDPVVAYADDDVKALTTLYARQKLPPVRTRCMSCRQAQQLPPHACPYNEEIVGDYTSACNCCGACKAACLQRAAAEQNGEP